MKNLTKVLCYNVAFFALVGCSANTTEESSTNSSKGNSAVEETKEDVTETNNDKSTSDLKEPANMDLNNTSTNTSAENTELNTRDEEGKGTLSHYSNEQIEYARVWLQLGPNQEIDELNVRHISAGELINPDDETSARYPENVVQLAGSRLVDGSVTYSSKGNGTIKVYNVPLRWNGGIPRDDLEEGVMRRETEKIIESAKSVYVNPGDDKKIIKLIKLLNVQK